MRFVGEWDRGQVRLRLCPRRDARTPAVYCSLSMCAAEGIPSFGQYSADNTGSTVQVQQSLPIARDQPPLSLSSTEYSVDGEGACTAGLHQASLVL